MTIDFTSFASVFAWVSAHSYFFIFLIMCVEGPITTAAAGFAAALGLFNPWIILTISILGDVVPDSIYYAIGYFGNTAAVNRFGKILDGSKIAKERLAKVEKLLHENFGKAMLVFKLTPLLAPLGFVATGSFKAPFGRFLKIIFLVTLVKSIIFLSLGYFFGQLYDIETYIHYAGIFIPVAFLLGVGAYLAYKKIVSLILEKNEKL